jgi:hypothetical protein
MGEIKARFAGFLKLNGIISFGEGKYVSTRFRLNPNAITSYYATEFIPTGEDPKQMVTVYCGHPYMVDMSLEEFDKCMEEIERGISFEEPM